MYLSERRNGGILEVQLSGDWRGGDMPAIDAQLATVVLSGVSSLRVDVPDSLNMDLAGAWRLREWLEEAGRAGVAVEFTGPKPGQVQLIDATLAGNVHAAPPTSSESRFEPVSALGRHVTRRWESLLLALDFIGRTTATALRACTS